MKQLISGGIIIMPKNYISNPTPIIDLHIGQWDCLNNKFETEDDIDILLERLGTHLSLLLIEQNKEK